MKVLVVSNLYPPDVIGGYELACGQLVDALRLRGHDLRVLTAAPRSTILEDAPHVHRRLVLSDEWNPNASGSHPVVRRSREIASRVVNAHNVHVLIGALRGFAPDVVLLSNLVGLGGLGLLGCLRHLGAPWVWHLGDYIPLELCSDRDGLVPGLAGLFTRLVRGRYVAGSRRVVEGCSVGGLRLEGPVDLVPYWITGERGERRHSYHRKNRLRILSVGRLDSQKGTDLLIEAAALLRDEGVDGFTLDLIGAAAGPEFPLMIRRLGLDSIVTLRGVYPHSAMVKAYAEYDLLAFPTRTREPFGLVALEAAAAGCVPMLTRDCGAAEWLVHGAHCLKVDRTARSIAGTFREVLAGRIDLAPIARRAAEAAWRDFHLDVVLPKIERALRLAAVEGRGWRPDPAASAEAYHLALLADRLAHRTADEAVPA